MSSIANPPVFELARQEGAHLTFAATSENHIAHVFVLEEDIIRVMVLPDGKLNHPATWAVAPGLDDVPPQGRDRFDLSGFNLPGFTLSQGEDTFVLTTAQLRLTITRTGFKCSWETCLNSQWLPAAADRVTEAVNFGWWDQRVYHYLQRTPDDMYFGLGERTGDTNRHGRRFSMINVDCPSYNARTTDPLYKHIPFHLSWHRTNKVPLGIFYDTSADCHFDMGCTIDAYNGLFRSFVAEHGDLDYYIIGGASLLHIVQRYTWLTGRPALMPRWGLGYSGSTMAYTDAPDAQERMNEFLAHCEEHDILCDSFHLSSGYTSIGDKRYVFNWNKSKFPDPARFVKHYRDHGIRLIPNIKPCLLHDHPRYAEAAARGLFVKDPDGTPNMAQFWGGFGSYLDFTNPEAATWWESNIKSTLLDFGMAAMWNDNNEYEIWNSHARAHQFGTPRPAAQAKPLQTMLMVQSSRRAQVAHDPARRPFLVTRAGFTGMQRYVQTWSGDNYTSWETLKYNIKMGVGLALSGVSNTGHDIGGFEGPVPSPELFVRWIQAGLLLPRFSIHSWKPGEIVNEPWMYPEATPQIRDLIRFRYRLLPHLYHLLWRSHVACEPVIRATFLAFPDDPRCYEENDEFLLGDHLLVAAVVEENQTTRRVYLPAGTAWYDLRDGNLYTGGQEVTVSATLKELPPLFVREGAVLALNVAEQHFNRPADARGFALFPHQGPGVVSTQCFDDDGEQLVAMDDADQHLWQVRLESTATAIDLHLRCPAAKPTRAVTIVLPAKEMRPLRCAGWTISADRQSAMGRQITLNA
ncbi:glycoside hydrolase family 31 protein [Silvimonas amylolytica]|uniref:Glucosidase n=1 Tax=Silvimonas amylolytica TaxID=449663 RepID=A0ABQ2PNI2_9NEIS|nr:glycoside hydrolase family 31 protein [Silvimonas amylolytica]GGP26766.1 glucosidase [Silvimonas amylolytica]